MQQVTKISYHLTLRDSTIFLLYRIAMSIRTITLDPDFLMTAVTRSSEAAMLHRLADHHARGSLSVAMVGLPPVDETGGVMASLADAMRDLGLDHLDICLPMFDKETGTIEQCLPRSEEGIRLQSAIHQILFPNRAFEYDDARRKYGIVDNDTKRFRQKWVESRRNVQTIWAHINSGRDILVSNNQNFFKRTKMPSLISAGTGSISRLEYVASNSVGF